jgi:hypothetical protein
MFESLTQKGWTEDMVAKSLSDMSTADRERALKNAWLKKYKTANEGGNEGALGAAVAGFGESATFGLTKLAAGAVGAVKGLVTELDPVEGARQGRSAYEDRMTFHELTNPEAYNLANFAGYVTPGSLGMRIASGLGKTAKAASLGAKGTAALIGGGTELARSTVTQVSEGDLSLGQTAADTAIGAVGGFVAQAGINALASGGRSLKAGASEALAAASKKYSSAMGKLTPEAAEILEKAPQVLKVQQGAIMPSKTSEMSKQVLGVIDERINELQASLDIPESEMTQTAKGLKEGLVSTLKSVSQEISEQASTARGFAKEQIATAFKEVKAYADRGRAIVTDQYGARIKPLEQLGQNLKMNLDDSLDDFASPLIDAGVLVDNTGKLTNAPLAQKLKPAIAKIFKHRSAAKDPITLKSGQLSDGFNFEQVNKLKMFIGETVDWDAQDPLNVGLKNLYTSLRGKLTEAAFTMPTDINVNKLFSEYASAMKLTNRFKNTFYGKAADGSVTDVLPSAATIKTLVNEARGFSELQPIVRETQKKMSRILRLSARDSQLKRFTDPLDVAKTVSSLTKSDFFDETSFLRKVESVVGKVKNRQQIFDIADSWNLPNEAKAAIKAGGGTFKEYLQNLPSFLQGSKGELQALHDKWHKSLRANGYKANEVFETLKSKGALDELIAKDWYELAALDSYVADIVDAENLMKLAKAPEAKLKLLPSLGRSAVGGALALSGAPGLAVAAGFLERTHAILTQPAALRLLAEKHKWVPSSQVAEWSQKIALLATKVLPAVRSGSAAKAMNALKPKEEKK